MKFQSVVLTLDRLHEVVDYFMKQDAFAFDVETAGDNRAVPSQNTVTWLSLATYGMAVSIPMGHPNGDVLISKATRRKNKETGKFDPVHAVWDTAPKQMYPGEVFSALRPLFFSDKTKVGHNVIFDLVSVAKYYDGTVPPGPYADTKVMQWLLDENLRPNGLKDLVKRYYSVDYDTENVGRRVESWGFSIVAKYSYLDSKYTWLLYRHFLPRISEQDLDRVWTLEAELIGVLCAMNLNGQPVDVESLKQLDVELSKQLVKAEAAIYKAAGRRFNLNSVPQKVEILYGPKSKGGQGLRVRKKTPAGQPSTDAEALKGHASNSVVAALIEYQKVKTLLNTYVRGYLGDPDDPKKPCIIFDGRVHADLMQHGTVTGRFSCREPNLQNIPRPDEDREAATKIRGLFIAPPGHKLVVADYSTIEMRLLAHFIGRGRLFDDLLHGGDPHSATAAALLDVSYDDFLAGLEGDDHDLAAKYKKMRQVSKGINFAIVYGAGPDKVASMAKVSVEDAKNFLNIHQRTFPEIYRFKKSVITKAKSRRPPHIRTLLGRKRRLPEIFSKEQQIAGRAERQAVNSLIQGSAADIIKLAMVRLHTSLEPGMQLTLSVHDELVTIVPDNMVATGSAIVREAMLGEGIQSLVKVPLISDLKVVDRWAEAK